MRRYSDGSVTSHFPEPTESSGDIALPMEEA
jgi:hypothetical protein